MVVIVLLFLALVLTLCAAFGAGTVAGVGTFQLGVAFFIASVLWPMLKLG